MKTKLFAIIALLLPVFAVAQAASSSAPPAMPVEEIIRRFAAKEKQFRLARENYTYRQTVKVLDMGSDGESIRGKYELTEDILFSGQGRRIEKVIYSPVETLQSFSMSPDDMRDLHQIHPFFLTSHECAKYNVR